MSLPPQGVYCLICAKNGVYAPAEYIVRWADWPGALICSNHNFNLADLQEFGPAEKDITEQVSVQFKIE